MPTLNIFDTDKEAVGSIDLDASVFGVEVREHLFHAAVRYQMAKKRAGTHATKGRALISGGGKKPFRQKGTGRARQGTTRAPHWRGGGVVHGPHYRSHAHKLSKRTRRAALTHVGNFYIGRNIRFTPGLAPANKKVAFGASALSDVNTETGIPEDVGLLTWILEDRTLRAHSTPWYGGS